MKKREKKKSIEAQGKQNKGRKKEEEGKASEDTKIKDRRYIM